MWVKNKMQSYAEILILKSFFNMRNIFIFLMAMLSLKCIAQPATPGVQKIKHEALEINNNMAYYKSKPYTGLSFTFWDNKKIHEEFSWKDGLKSGVYKEFTDEGNLFNEITYANGLKNGHYTYHYPSGAKEAEGNFKDEALDGEIISYYYNGIVRYKNNYSSGVRSGPSQSWYGNGAPEQVSFFVNDLPDGEVIAFYPDSLVRYECVYKNGVRNGRYYLFHKSGCAAEESYYKNGKIDSVRRIWNEINCALIGEENYALGIKSGAFYDFDINGDTLKMETWYEGKLNGLYKFWKSKSEVVKVNRKKHKGDAHLFTRSNGIDIIGNYVSGLPDGFWQYGLYTHYQCREGNYDQGTMVGEWKFYDADGKLLMKQWFDQNGDVTKEKHFRKSKK